ncbi:MAG TPA: ester cyclase [Anaerolineae bacterium]
MIPELNKSIVNRWYDEVANAGNSEVADDLFVDNYVDHSPPSPSEVWPTGAEGARQSLATYRAAFPDLHFIVDHMVAEGDDVAVRYTFEGTHRGPFLGVPATGNHVRFTGISLYRILGDKIVESWSEFDLLAVIRQLGSWPESERPGAESPGEIGPVL